MTKYAECKAVKKLIHEEIQKCFSVSEICDKYRELLYCGQKNIEAAVLKEVVDRGWGKAPQLIAVSSYTPTLLETDEQLKQLLSEAYLTSLKGKLKTSNQSH